LSILEKIKDSKYILLETYKKNNKPVRTPVWFVYEDDLLYVVTRDKTGKVKRLRNNSQVKFSVCTFNGKSLGKWISGTAKFAKADKTSKAIDMRKKKYGYLEKVARFVSKSKGSLVVFSITVD